jgi:hypothetical protein
MTGLGTQPGSENLLAMNYCYDGVCAPVPDNQWVLEFENYFSTTLAVMHQNSLAYVAGPLNAIYRPYWAPAIANDSWMCDSQIVMDNKELDYRGLQRLFRGLFHRKHFQYDNVFDWTIVRFLEEQEAERETLVSEQSVVET